MKPNYLRLFFLACILICVVLFASQNAFAQTERVKIYGAALSRSVALQQALQNLQIKPEEITSVNDLNADKTRLLILAGENALPASSRLQLAVT